MALIKSGFVVAVRKQQPEDELNTMHSGPDVVGPYEFAGLLNCAYTRLHFEGPSAAPLPHSAFAPHLELVGCACLCAQLLLQVFHLLPKLHVLVTRVCDCVS